MPVFIYLNVLYTEQRSISQVNESHAAFSSNESKLHFPCHTQFVAAGMFCLFLSLCEWIRGECICIGWSKMWASEIFYPNYILFTVPNPYPTEPNLTVTLNKPYLCKVPNYGELFFCPKKEVKSPQCHLCLHNMTKTSSHTHSPE